MSFIKKTWVYLMLFALGFSILPYIIMAWRGNEMFVHIIALAPFCLIISVVYGVRNRFSVGLPVIVGVIFIISMLIFYNFVSWEYALIYAVISLIGVVGGSLFSHLFRHVL